MSSSVSVLAPNGRRQIVKCGPNTTIIQILEDVCKKQGFKPEQYDLRHHNKVLDTSSSFRFSGLPNNAQLELTPAVKIRTDSEVVVAVNLESGGRPVGNFHPDETLWSVLTTLCPGEVDSGANPVVIYMRNEIYGEDLKKSSLRKLGLTGGRAMIRLMHRSPEELKVQANISAPLPAKVTEEKPFHRTLKPSQADSDKNNELFDGKMFPQNTNDADLKLAREKRKLNATPQKSWEVEVPKAKPKYEVPMEVDATNQLSTQSNHPEPAKEDFVFLGKRNAMLFSLESVHTVPIEDLPDNFFELTVDDAKRILTDIRKKQHEIENKVLMTAAMRQLEESKKQLRQLSRYKQAIIRIQFPDRNVLQGTFKPIETVKDVVDFVCEYLEDDAANFYLYTTPPKCILSEESRLMEVGCVPGALLHLGTDSDPTSVRLKVELANKYTTCAVAGLAASKMRVEHTRAVSPEEEPVEDNSMETMSDASAPGPSSRPTSYERKVLKSTEKVPKWFKPSK